ncbi:MAG TPA: DUF4747 family protein [Rhodocyclaceae bacterium]|nr:DUF4747 family protein [Rhodocyclaceae bacterium]
MSKESSFQMFGVNIVTHPHNPDGYVRLMKAAFDMRRSVKVHGSQHLMIGALRPLHSDRPISGLHGKFYRFVHIDKDAPWYNVSRHDDATDEERSQINIPDGLRPNTENFEFIFYPKGHTLYFSRRSTGKLNGHWSNLGPRQVATLLNTLFKNPVILDEFGEVEVTVLPDRSQLDRIFAIPTLQRLVIDVTKPNADALSKAQAKVFNRMDRTNTGRLKEELTARRGASIELDDDYKELATIAASNGKVEGQGYDGAGRPVKLSTVDVHWTARVAYNPEESETELDALTLATRSLPGHVGP